MTGTSYTYSENITAGATYSVRVKAENELGFGPYSSTLDIIAAAVPDAPTALAREDGLTDATRVSFSWTAPADQGVVEVLDYSVEVK